MTKNLNQINEANTLIDNLSLLAKEDLKKQDIKNSAITLVKKAFLHYQGSHQNLEVNFDSIKKMRQSFEQEHKKRFGFFCCRKINFY